MVDVITGASAGGKCAAIPSVMVQQAFEHIQTDDEQSTTIPSLKGGSIRSISTNFLSDPAGRSTGFNERPDLLRTADFKAHQGSPYLQYGLTNRMKRIYSRLSIYRSSRNDAKTKA